MNQPAIITKNIHHIGFTVPNLDQAHRFFIDIFGAHIVWEMEPPIRDGDWMLKNLNVNPLAEIRKYSLLRFPSGSALEIFEYKSPDQNRLFPKNSDIGGHHIAFFVDDIHKSVAELKSRGIIVLGEVKTFKDGPAKGTSWVYFFSPWGSQLELINSPSD